MCVNYRIPSHEQIRASFRDLAPPAFDYPPEVFAGQRAPLMLPVADDAGQAAEGLAWAPAMFGLVPHWAKDTKIARQTYNARAETVAEKPSYRTPWRRRQRGLVPMQCFFEPCYETGRAVRWSISRVDGTPFMAAAIWDAWRAPSGEILHSFSLLTINADAHPLMRRMHRPEDEKRTIAVVPPSAWSDWLRADTATAQALLVGPPDAFHGEAAPVVRPAVRAAPPDLFG